jgi:hypothetical protein
VEPKHPSNMDALLRFHHELRATVRLAGQKIVKLNFGRRNDPVLRRTLLWDVLLFYQPLCFLKPVGQSATSWKCTPGLYLRRTPQPRQNSPVKAAENCRTPSKDVIGHGENDARVATAIFGPQLLKM